MTSVPPSVPPSDEQPALAPRQLELYDALLRLDTEADGARLSAMYYGAVMVLKQPGNPDAVALAAHGLRELIEKLARRLKVPMAQTAGLTAKVSEMAARYQAVQSAPSHLRDDRQAEFWASAEDLATWFPTRHTPRMKWGSEVIDRLDPRQLKLPQPAKDAHVETWNRCHKCFQSAAHHQGASGEEFTTHFRLFEDFLIDQLMPRAVDDQRELEDIIREGEDHA